MHSRLARQIVREAATHVAGNRACDWSDVVKQLAIFDPEFAIRLLATTFAGENHQAADNARKVLRELASEHGDLVMAALGDILLDDNWRLQVELHRDLVAALPVPTVLTWVRSHGTEGARRLARHLPIPTVDEQGNPIVPELLDRILTEFDDDEVFANFMAGSLSHGPSRGNAAERYREDAAQARRFLSHPNRRIREWARLAIDRRLGQADYEDQEQEESFLPS